MRSGNLEMLKRIVHLKEQIEKVGGMLRISTWDAECELLTDYHKGEFFQKKALSPGNPRVSAAESFIWAIERCPADKRK